jgi:hypothetical protein
LTPHQVEGWQAAEERLQKQGVLDVHGGTLFEREVSAAQTIRRSERPPGSPDAVCVPGWGFGLVPRGRMRADRPQRGNPCEFRRNRRLLQPLQQGRLTTMLPKKKATVALI